MKNKIEIDQSNLIELLVGKVKFLTEEYMILHDAYKSNKGKITVDPLIISSSHDKFLKEYGDISRILDIYNLFISTEDTKKDDTQKNTRTRKKDDDNNE
jgi:hypothetical protein